MQADQPASYFFEIILHFPIDNSDIIVYTVYSVNINDELLSRRSLAQGFTGAVIKQKGLRMKIIVSNRSGIPIYEQIKEQVKEAIFSGELREDDMLPSIRQLARDLKISVITTTRAYGDLEEEGFVVNVQGKGCFVLPRNKELARENTLHRIEDNLSAAVAAAKQESISKEEIVEIINVLWEDER